MKQRRATFWLAVILLFFCTKLVYSQAEFWQQTSGPTGGSVTDLCTNSEGHIYAATYNYGGPSGSYVYLSTDRGDNWTVLSFLYEKSVDCLAIGPNDQVFAGTWSGVISSTDKGKTWTDTGLDTAWVEELVFSSSGHILAGTGNGVYCSLDNGGTWNHIGWYRGLVRALAVNSNGYIFIGTYGEGLYRSINGGASWTQTKFPVTGDNVSAIAINSSGHIFAGTTPKSTDDHPPAVYRSTDNADNWTQLGNGLMWAGVVDFAFGARGSIFAASGAGVYRFSDDYETWMQINVGLGNRTDFTALVIDKGGNIYAGTIGGGVFRSMDTGETWGQINRGLRNTYVETIAFNSSGHVFAGTERAGVFRSTDNGFTWAEASSGLAELDIAALAVNSMGHIFAGVSCGGLFRSTDNGDTWLRVAGDLIYCVSALATNPRGHIFAAGLERILRSIDDGNTWMKLTLGMPGSTYVRSLATGPRGEVFAVADRGILRSTDNGDTWSLTGSTFPSWSALAINSRGDIFAAGAAGVSRSTDNGASWKSLNVPRAQHEMFTSVALDPKENVYAGAWYGTGGVYRSTDNGTTWERIASGLTNPNIKSLAVTLNGYLFTGTYGSGVFRSTNPTSSVREIAGEIPIRFSLGQNYPNPFNPSTTIEFSIPRRGYVTLNVYNILGAEVATLVSQNLSAGTHRVEWYASGSPSGVYFYRLSASGGAGHTNGFIETKKLVLLR
jgi:photosystem II stability/assembly factor-like uncharacterized protein